jgi:hypothetical protein
MPDAPAVHSPSRALHPIKTIARDEAITWERFPTGCQARVPKPAVHADPLINSFVEAFQKLGDAAIKPLIECPKGFFDKTFVKEIFLDVSLDYGIEILLIPAEGPGCMINMHCARQMICDGFFLHGSVPSRRARYVPKVLAIFVITARPTSPSSLPLPLLSDHPG